MKTCFLPFVYFFVLLCEMHMLTAIGVMRQSDSIPAEHEKALFRHVTSNYDPNSRPVRHALASVNVSLLFEMKSVIELDEKKQVLTTNMVIHEQWIDENIVWSPQHFGNLHYLVLPTSRIWLPDIYVYNNALAGERGFVHVEEARALIDFTGSVSWSLPVILASSCSVDILYFPFDHQFCTIKLGSWIYDVHQLDLQLRGSGIDVKDLSENGELRVVQWSITRNVTRVVLGGERHYSIISIHIHIQRKALYYVYTVIAPSILLCVLTVFSFWLPCDCAQKIEIGLTVFLFLYFLQLLIAENTPESNSTPLIGTFLTMVTTLNSISLIMATFVMNLKNRSNYQPCPKVPRVMWHFCKNVLSRLTFTPFSKEIEHSYLEEHQGGTDSSDDEDYDVQQKFPASMANMYRWVFVAGVVDKFLFEIYFMGTVLSIFIILVIVPQNITNHFTHFNDTA